METTTKKETATIKDLVYEFVTLDGSDLDLNSKSKIFLKINDIETAIPIESVFIGKASIDDEDIMGYSILQMISDKTKLKIDANTILKITFIDKISGKEFHISNIRRPIMYDEDIEISSEDRLKYIDLLLATAEIPFQEAKIAEDKKLAEQEAELKKQKDEQEAEAEIKQKADKEAEAEIKQKADKEAEAEKKRADDEAEEMKLANVLGGLDWEEQRREFIDNGFKEHTFNDYRFFHKNGEGEDSPEFGFFFLSPGSNDFIELFEDDIDENKESYIFEDADENDCILIFDKHADSIDISLV